MSSIESTDPAISIIIPVFNRGALLQRAVTSCLANASSAIEVVISDDGSDDGAPEAVARLGDPRIRLIRSCTNRGVGPARNAGVMAARAPWVVFLDSDDEMLPHGLEEVSKHLQGMEPDVARCNFFYTCEDGVSPNPAPSQEVMDYRAYILWLDVAVRSDMLVCARTETFRHVRFAESRGRESLYHIDFHKKYRSKMIAARVARINVDAANRVSNLEQKTAAVASRRDAADELRELEGILAEHGREIRVLAPKYFNTIVRRAVTQAGLTGDRRKTLSAYLRYSSQCTLSVKVGLVALIALLSPGMLAMLRATELRRRRC